MSRPVRVVSEPRPYRPVQIPPGTKVQARMSGRIGIVQTYKANALGTFSVAWCDGSQMWSLITADDVEVIAVAEPQTKPERKQSA